MRTNVGISPTVLILAGALALAGLGCSGGDSGGGPAPSGLSVTVTGFSSPAPGVICATFEVRGGSANALVNLIAEYVRLTNATLEIPATPVSAALANQLALNLTVGTDGEVTLDANGEFLTGQFYWWAGQDLGFIQDSVRVCLTPVDPLTSTAGTTGCTTFFVYDVGQPSSSSAGGGPGSVVGGQPTNMPGTGRAGHVAQSVRAGGATTGTSKDVLIAGGYNNSAQPNAFGNADRFAFSNGSHTNPFSQAMSDRRVLHAASSFIDPSTNGLRVLVCGGVDGAMAESVNPGPPDLASRVAGTSGTPSASSDVYSLAPEMIVPAAAMNTPRLAHTATWVPQCNAVVVIGGATGATLTGLNTIEWYDPAANTWTTSTATLATARVEHTTTLLADGRLLIVGGYDPAAPGIALTPEVFDFAETTVVSVSAAGQNVALAANRTGHTATRLFDGRVLVAGGRDLAGALLDSAVLVTPLAGAISAPAYTFTSLTMRQARARHAATVLGTGLVLLTGGVSLDGSSAAEFTNAAEIFNPSFVQGPTPFTNPFSSVNFMTESRSEHSMTATECGSVFIIGGRNQASGAAPFVDSIEFYAFSNALPTVSNAMTATSTSPAMLAISFTVADAEADGGYVIVRYRTSGSTKWLAAVIDSQIGPTAMVTSPATGRVTAGSHQFLWNFTANGLTSGTAVDIQLIPVGAVIGSAIEFAARIP